MASGQRAGGALDVRRRGHVVHALAEDVDVADDRAAGPAERVGATETALAPAPPPEMTTWKASNSLRAASSVALVALPAASPGRTFCVAEVVHTDCANAADEPNSERSDERYEFCAWCIGRSQSSRPCRASGRVIATGSTASGCRRSSTRSRAIVWPSATGSHLTTRRRAPRIRPCSPLPLPSPIAFRSPRTPSPRRAPRCSDALRPRHPPGGLPARLRRQPGAARAPARGDARRGARALGAAAARRRCAPPAADARRRRRARRAGAAVAPARLRARSADRHDARRAAAQARAPRRDAASACPTRRRGTRSPSRWIA